MKYYDENGNEVFVENESTGPIYVTDDTPKEPSELQKSCGGCIGGCGCMTALVLFIPFCIYILYLLW